VKLRSPLLGFVGLLVLGTLSLSLVRGEVSITDAAARMGIVAGVLIGLDRFVLPLAAAFIVGRRAED
jgi:hypothetical protein